MKLSISQERHATEDKDGRQDGARVFGVHRGILRLRVLSQMMRVGKGGGPTLCAEAGLSCRQGKGKVSQDRTGGTG